MDDFPELIGTNTPIFSNHSNTYFTTLISLQFKCMADQYTKIEKIGQGACGTVYKAKHNQTNEIVAIKKFKELGSNEGIPQNCLREIQILRTLEHRKDIATIKHVFMHESGHVYAIFDYYKCNLKHIITSGKEINWKRFIQQMVEAVAGIHEVNILHRDLKPQNILIGNDNQPLLADFGFAKQLELGQKMTNMVGTQAYRAPELILGDVKYGKSVDVWSTGCIIYEIFSKKVLFQCGSEVALLYKMFNLFPNTSIPSNLKSLSRFQGLITKFESYQPQPFANPLETIPEEFHQLVIRMLDLNPQTRISAKEALSLLK